MDRCVCVWIGGVGGYVHIRMGRCGWVWVWVWIGVGVCGCEWVDMGGCGWVWVGVGEEYMCMQIEHQQLPL